MILWRQLLDSINVRWVDHGANTARGHINCPCPWCGIRDPSHHLSINETTGAYRCYRTGGEHRGRSTPYLLMALGVPPYQIDGLLRTYSDDAPPTRLARPKPVTPWTKLSLASSYPAALQYLRSRGFQDPATIAQRYDLRMTIIGQYSWRVLLPLHLNREIIGFTGRALNDNQEPKYLTYDPTEGTSLYIPFFPNKNTRTVIFVEGPFDALQITNAFPQHEVIGIGLTGLAISPARLEHISTLIPGIQRVLFTLDNDQPLHVVRRLKAGLASIPGIPYPERFPLPDDVHDPGQMRTDQIRAWALAA